MMGNRKYSVEVGWASNKSCHKSSILLYFLVVMFLIYHLYTSLVYAGSKYNTYWGESCPQIFKDAIY